MDRREVASRVAAMEATVPTASSDWYPGERGETGFADWLDGVEFLPKPFTPQQSWLWIRSILDAPAAACCATPRY
jgi:hypothetical protein